MRSRGVGEAAEVLVVCSLFVFLVAAGIAVEYPAQGLSVMALMGLIDVALVRWAG